MLEFPVRRDYRITSGYGHRLHPISGIWSGHNGIDLAIPVGTPLYAPDKGTITSSFTNDIGGNQAVITHPGGVKTGYAHLQSKLPQGSTVQRGEIFAYSGDTGRVTGPHLHLTVRKGGELVDPQAVTWSSGGTNRLSWMPLAGLVALSAYLIYKNR